MKLKSKYWHNFLVMASMFFIVVTDLQAAALGTSSRTIYGDTILFKVCPGDQVVIPNGFARVQVVLCDGATGDKTISISGESTKQTQANISQFVALNDEARSRVPGTHVYRYEIVENRTSNQLFSFRSSGFSEFFDRMPIGRAATGTSAKFLRLGEAPLGESWLSTSSDRTLAIQSLLAKYNFWGGPLWVGIRSANWMYDRREIHAMDWINGLIHYVPTEAHLFYPGPPPSALKDEPFQVFNLPPQNPGQWASRTGEVLFWPSDRNVNSYVTTLFDGRTMAHSDLDAGLYINLNGFTGHLVVKDLVIHGTASNALSVISEGEVSLDGIETNWAGETGIYVRTRKNISVQNSDVANSQNSGLILEGHDVIVARNRLDSNGRLGSALRPQDKQTGISVSARGLVHIDANEIRKTGGNGISTNTAPSGIVVTSNYIEDSCLELNDCSSLYISSNYTYTRPTKRYVIDSNSFVRARGDWTERKGVYARRMTAGVYLDFCASNYSITNNNFDNTSAPNAMKDDFTLADIFSLGPNEVKGNRGVTSIKLGPGTNPFCKELTN